jgi:GNAT superfamily N-acetyltransferase
MLAAETVRAVDAYWAGVFGCTPEELRPSAPTVLPRPPGDASTGVYVMTFGAAPIAMLPSARYATAREEVMTALADGLNDTSVWPTVFPGAVEAVIGPATIRYADRGTFRPLPPSDAVRLLDADDRPALERLRAACAVEEWAHGGSELEAGPVVGAFAGGELTAVAGYEVWGDALAHLSVVTHPGFRGRGHGAAAVSLAADAALVHGLVAQYRTLESNAPSVAIAVRLGFVPFARSLAVRLRTDDHLPTP